MLTVKQVIEIARSHLENGAAMASSARVSLGDAVRCYDLGDFERARSRALDSLKYSVGIFHADYARAAK